MAKLTFRQGIVRQQRNILNQPFFLQVNLSGKVDLLAANEPTVITLAHGTTDYLFSEPITVANAWMGPFPGGFNYFLYWDLDTLTGLRTFNHTIVTPVFGPTQPVAPPLDLHWFNTTTGIMSVWNGVTFITRIRVFAGQLQNGSVLIQNGLGTQVGITNVDIRAGFFLFDDDGKPVKKFDRFNRGVFITTETPLSSQFARISRFRLEATETDARAAETIPRFFAVAITGPGEISLARNTVPDAPAIGIASEDMFPGEVRTYITYGFVKDNSFNFTEPSGTSLYVGPTGELQTAVPQTDSLQKIGIVVDPKVIFINVEELMEYA